MPTDIRPMLATAGTAFDSQEHYFEVKWDGIRSIAYIADEDMRMQTRNLKEALPRFPELLDVKKRIKASQAVLDGEIVIFDDSGVPNFELARARNAQRDARTISWSQSAAPASYVVFDCLYVTGENLMPLPFADRLERLKHICSPGGTLIVSKGLVGAGQSLFAFAVQHRLEGIVGKALHSPYHPGVRSPHWIKVRNVKAIDAVVGGFVPKGRRLLKSVLLGAFTANGRLKYIGHVGTGFSADENASLRRTLDGLVTEKSPFAPAVARAFKEATWVTPHLVVAVEYLALTPAGRLRHPVYRGVRLDKEAREALLDVLSFPANGEGD